uniref:C-type lectin domain-containing protein n=1 Tax=Biomphalaria glabrata TaxID=6526 RepID=A0A2C9JEB3_BIOGL
MITAWTSPLMVLLCALISLGFYVTAQESCGANCPVLNFKNVAKALLQKQRELCSPSCPSGDEKAQTDALLSKLFNPPVIYNNKRYAISKIPYSDSDEAMAYCNAFGGYLAEVDDASEYKVLQSYVLSNPDDIVLIGGTDKAKEGTWTFQRTCMSIPFLDWCSAQPDNYGDEDCLSFWKYGGGKMNDIQCLAWGVHQGSLKQGRTIEGSRKVCLIYDNKKYVISKIPYRNSDEAMTYCTAFGGYLAEIDNIEKNKTYVISKFSHKDSDEAMAYCQAFGGYLAEVDDYREFKELQKFFMSSSVEEMALIAGSNAANGETWRFQRTGVALPFESWGRGEPNNDFGNEESHHLAQKLIQLQILYFQAKFDLKDKFLLVPGASWCQK